MDILLANKIPHGSGSPVDFMSPPVCSSFALIPATPQEILDSAKGAKYLRATGPDGIDPLIRKRTILQTAEIMSEIINSSFDMGSKVMCNPSDLNNLGSSRFPEFPDCFANMSFIFALFKFFLNPRFTILRLVMISVHTVMNYYDSFSRKNLCIVANSLEV